MRAMTYLSVCSGIEAATVAWHPLGWTPVAFSEIEAFPSAVLKHHYPTVPNWGDLTKFHDWPDAAFDVLVGGTPCQSFSVAGLRAGLADPRGNLALTYLAVAERYRPKWVVWENVPGVLSSTSHDAPDPCLPPDHLEEGAEWVGEDEYDADESHAFACFLAGLSELGYRYAYRTPDAQYFGLAQRRARVFVVGHLRDWRRAAAVFLERHSLSGHPAPSRETREDYPASTLRSTDGGLDCDHAAAGHLVAHALRADGFDASEDGTGRGTPIVPIAFSVKDHGADAGDVAPTLRAGTHDKSHANGGVMPAVAFNWQSGGDARGLKAQAQAQALSRSQTPAVAFQEAQTGVREYDTAGTLRAEGPGHDPVGTRVRHGMQVRRLTPRECERLQGFPDDYTLIPYRGKPAKDGPRYKALGNSMAVPVMAWIGKRIALVESIGNDLEATA